MARLYMFLAILLTFPGIYLWGTGTHVTPGMEATLFGLAILGAAFLISWAAEVAQKDISQALAVAILALIAVLPEYAVDMVFAWEAARDPVYGHYALANMTGANRLLVGIGWPAVVMLWALKYRKVGIRLGPQHRIEVLYLGLATAYSIFIPLKGALTLIDAAVLVTIFALYAVRVAKAEVHEPELVGPALWIGGLPDIPRRLVATAMFLFSGGVIAISAHPFAHSLVAAGKSWGIDEFLLVQWLAPLASESPEFLVAIIWTLRGDPESGLGTLVSSKVNQWTLLVGTIPIVYSISLGAPGALPLDTMQQHELWLTAAQSLFAVTLLVNLSLAWYGATLLLVLFLAQFIFPDIRMEISVVYLVLALGLMIRDRRHYLPLLRGGLGLKVR